MIRLLLCIGILVLLYRLVQSLVANIKQNKTDEPHMAWPFMEFDDTQASSSDCYLPQDQVLTHLK